MFPSTTLLRLLAHNQDMVACNYMKRYVELIGGTISFLSVIDEGTEFTVQFPRNTN
jgi:sensor histidine kinase regulating citrate/malate metabolism